MTDTVQITLNIPAGALWLVVGMLALNTAISIWHGIEMRRYRKVRAQETPHD